MPPLSSASGLGIGDNRTRHLAKHMVDVRFIRQGSDSESDGGGVKAFVGRDPATGSQPLLQQRSVATKM